MLLSDIFVRLVNPAGGSIPTTALDMLTAYAKAPLPTAIAPGSAVVVDEALPDAELCAPTGCADTASTPRHDESITPPSGVACDNCACTPSTMVGSGLGSGKFCALVATYVAMLTPPDVTRSTRR